MNNAYDTNAARSASGELPFQHEEQYNVRMQDSSPKVFPFGLPPGPLHIE